MNSATCSTVLGELELTAGRCGERIAVADEHRQFTWQQLRDTSYALAAQLVERILPNTPVIVAAERRAETPLLFFAVLQCGCFYLPLDPEMPAARMQLVCESSGATVALGCGERPDALPDAVDWVDCTGLAADHLPTAHQIALLTQRRSALNGDSPLYLVYTSGSTGVPKGVLKQHKAMQSFVTAFLEEYPIHETDIMGNQTPFSFDASAKDLYWCLRTGCRLEILPTRLFSFPVELVNLMNKVGVTLISWVPSALAMISQLGTFDCVLPQTLRAVFFVGEVFPTKQLARWRTALPDLLYVNLYGSSEIAGVCCHAPILRDYAPEESLPLGRPLSHCKLTLLTENGPTSAPNQEGELCIESEALAAGYYHDPERTAAAFRLDNGRRTLHTGDMAMINDSGELIFTSRKDFQIKHMGYRIELGEIESAANALPGIEKSACVYDSRRSRILLFVQPSADQPAPEANDLLTQLKDRLCSYMLPKRITVMEQLPLNPNGKIDRVQLQQLAANPPRRR